MPLRVAACGGVVYVRPWQMPRALYMPALHCYTFHQGHDKILDSCSWIQDCKTWPFMALET